MQRFKPENVLLVGIIPGLDEPKLNINTYLQPLVAKLNVLWKNGVIIKPHGSTSTSFDAALLCVGCDVPAARKVCGFSGHALNKATVTTKIDFSGFDPCPVRNNFEHQEQAQEILSQISEGDSAGLEQIYGTRYTELMQLPYFDYVRSHFVDPCTTCL